MKPVALSWIHGHTRGLEMYPRVLSKLEALWGTKECREYLSSCLLQERDELREGFMASALFALGKLLNMHDTEFPQFEPKQDAWDAHYV